MLDSAPVASPPIPRSLKRSASTASLPTPPRTHRKLSRGKSSDFCDSASDEDVAYKTSDDELLVQRHKKRRVGESKPLLYRRGQAQVDVEPVSPPPSHRRLVVSTPKRTNARKPEPHIATDSPPVTPQQHKRSPTRRAIRDSPDNPFLATPENQAEDSSGSSDSSANSSPHGPLQERPTIAYVFRGVRRECKNPLYNHAQDRPFSPPPESKLAIDHPDYSPAIHCTPKRLFVHARPKRQEPAASKEGTLTRKRARQRSPSFSFSDDEDAVGEIRPLKLNFGPEKRAGAQTLDQELKDAGESVSL